MSINLILALVLRGFNIVFVLQKGLGFTDKCTSKYISQFENAVVYFAGITSLFTVHAGKSANMLIMFLNLIIQDT